MFLLCLRFIFPSSLTKVTFIYTKLTLCFTTARSRCADKCYVILCSKSLCIDFG